jgi:hypothetical protein
MSDTSRPTILVFAAMLVVVVDPAVAPGLRTLCWVLLDVLQLACRCGPGGGGGGGGGGGVHDGCGYISGRGRSAWILLAPSLHSPPLISSTYIQQRVRKKKVVEPMIPHTCVHVCMCVWLRARVCVCAYTWARVGGSILQESVRNTVHTLTVRHTCTHARMHACTQAQPTPRSSCKHAHTHIPAPGAAVANLQTRNSGLFEKNKVIPMRTPMYVGRGGGGIRPSARIRIRVN